MSRKALIIGNNAYQINPLQTCVNDTTDLANQLLKQVQFDVVLKTDLMSSEMYHCIKQFTNSIQPEDFVIFFFAGHGVRCGDQNFLLPCDNQRIQDCDDMQRFAINAQRMTNQMADKSPHAIIILLNCCREYPLPKSDHWDNQISQGLVKMDPPRETLIAFPCACGYTTTDPLPNSRNSVFTKYLLRHITTPNIDIDIILRRVAKDVSKETNNTQIPYRITSILEENVYVVSSVSKKSNTTLQDPKTIVVDRNDPNSPLQPLKTFQELNLKPELLKGIYNMGIHAPSKIQAIALPVLLGNPRKNIIAQSQSGTGKTTAFSLAILSRIDPSIQRPQALILAPTVELAIQIGSMIELMAQFLPYIKIAYAVRDPSISKKSSRVRGQLLTEPIIIGTPGTVEEWHSKLCTIDLKQLRACCIDEADFMIDVEGFQEICIRIVSNLDILNCQIMLFSTTYSDQVMEFARQNVPNAVVLRLRREKQALTNIKQYFIECYSDEAKYQAIEQIYAQLTVGKTMVFCRTNRTAHDLAVRMANDGHSVKSLTATSEAEVRAAIIQQFRDGIFRVLICTNIITRGLNFDDVSLVVNYDMSMTVQFESDYETYLHRIGRCGRFGKLGYAFNLIGSERDCDVMKEIEDYFSHPIEEITIESIGQLEQDQA